MQRLINNNINTVDHWDEVYLNNNYDLTVDKRKFTQIASSIIDGSSVVDFGCGHGELLETIKELKPQCRLTGVDFVNHLKDKEIKFIQADFNERIDYLSEFDYAICCETLEHVDYPQGLVWDIYDSLKKGGVAILTTPYLDHLPSGEHVWEFDYKDIEHMMREFEQVWVFPYATGRGVIMGRGTVKYPSGHFDDIMAIGVK